MSKKDILSIVCKIFGIYFLVMAIDSLQFVGTILMYVIDSLGQRVSGGASMVLGFLVPFLVYIYAAFYFIRRSDVIAEKLCGATTSNSVQVGIDKDTLQQILFSAVGVFIIASALTSLIHTLTLILGQNYAKESLSQAMKIPVTMLVMEPLDLAWPLIKFIANSLIGLYLIFGSSKLVALIKKYSNRSK